MKLILFGCTGLIGSELIPTLLQSGHELTIVSRKKKPKVEFIEDRNKIQFLQADPSSPESWKKTELLDALEKVEGVINLVGEPIAEKRWSKKHLQKIQDSRIDTTRYLIAALSKRKKPVKVIINGSAIGFYGTSLNKVFNEKSIAGKDFLAKLCDDWEKVASNKAQQTRLVIIRTGIVLSKDGGALGKMLPFFKIGLGGPIGSGMQWMSWIHRTDLCEIIGQALTNQAWSGTFNAVSPNPVVMKEFAKNLGKVLNRPSLLHVPETILKLILGDGAKVVLEGQKVTSNRLRDFNFKFKYPELSEALIQITDLQKVKL